MKKYILFTIYICICFLSVHTSAFASIVISEVAYDIEGIDQDHEWIEVYNNGVEAVSLVGYKFNDGTNHNLVEPPGGGGKGVLSIAPNGYVILSGNATVFLVDHPSYAGTVIDTVMSLNNEGDTLSLISPEGTIVYQMTYTSADGASGDGNTLHRVGTSYISGKPTPGAVYVEEESVDEEVTEEVQTENEAGVKKEVIKLVPPKIDIVSKTTVSTNVVQEFNAKTTDERKQNIFLGKWVWNMGDGNTYQLGKMSKVFHTFEHEGEYVVSVEYYESILSEEPLLADKMVVKVIEPDIAVNTFVHRNGLLITEIVNNGPLEIPFSFWKLQTRLGNYFIFPKNTVLLPNKKLFITQRATGFNVDEGKNITLLYPNNQRFIPLLYQVKSDTQTIKKEDTLILNAQEKKESIPTKDPWEYMPSIVFVVLLLVSAFGIIYSKKLEDIENDEKNEETGIIVT